MTLPPRLVIASHNAGKVAEIADLLKPFAVRVTGTDELGLDEPEETGETFEANAALKAAAAMRSTGLPALGDDSGFAVDALEGAPGIHSARWAGPDRDFAAAITRLERALAGSRSPSASFHCVLALGMANRRDEDLPWPRRGNAHLPGQGMQRFRL